MYETDPRLPVLNELLDAQHEGADLSAEQILAALDAATKLRTQS